MRQALIFAVCGLVAVILGWQLADGKVFSFDFTGIVAAGAVAISAGAVLVRVFRLPADVALLGAVVFGYILGNRGFAQLMLAPSLPILPAEAALGLAGGWWIVASAFERRLPWDRDWLNRLILLWLIVGGTRLFFDVRSHGFLAIRDFAMVYYATFFFIAQRMARLPAAARYLGGCFLVATVLLPIGVELYGLFPRFFVIDLTVQDSPLIYYKGDLAYTFVAIGSFLVFFVARDRHRFWAWPLAALLFLFVAAGDNRASLCGAILVLVGLLVAWRWQYAAVHVFAGAVALAVMIVLSVGFQNAWASNRLHGIVDRARSVADVRGLASYSTEESSSKGDNNRFRLVWWHTVVLDTWNGNPWFGLGFGADLAKSFVQEYSPDLDEEFTTRSPHNIFLSVFGRMGLAGVLVWTALLGTAAIETWRTWRRQDSGWIVAFWCGVWVILVSACFGVVLEGPMGAVPFWTLLGLAHGLGRKPSEAETIPT
ncbi:MAG TPA: O-antigen ligase family protein [Candidatus Didemnitutus sp.]|nr:O-antigen ligase family protein [Candidatus Didemnitutus sp.]